MVTTQSIHIADGPHAEQIRDFAGLIENLWQSHGTSFTQAGDEKIYSFGGFEHIVVVSEAKFEGLIEIQTPAGNLDLKPDDQGAIAIAKCQTKDGQPADADRILATIITGLKNYYARRPRFTEC